MRDLTLSKIAVKILSSRLNEKHILHPSTCITCYRQREDKAYQYFSQLGSILVCHNIEGLLLYLGAVSYGPHDWNLFLYSSKQSLKCVRDPDNALRKKCQKYCINTMWKIFYSVNLLSSPNAQKYGAGKTSYLGKQSPLTPRPLPNIFAKTTLLNSSLNPVTWFQLKKNVFSNITWSCSPLIQLNYVIIYHILFIFLFLFTFSILQPYSCLSRNWNLHFEEEHLPKAAIKMSSAT